MHLKEHSEIQPEHLVSFTCEDTINILEFKDCVG